MKAVTYEEFLNIANELAQQQVEYFDGLVLETFKKEGHIFVFGAKGMNDQDGKLSAEKLEASNKLIGKIEPILRANYIIVE